MNLFSNQVNDADFMSELEAATSTRPALSSIVLLFSIIGLIVFGVVWACVSEVEEITRGSGQVVPTQEIQIVQSLEGGVLQELLVKQGHLVKKGQVLLRISDVQFSSQERGAEAQFLSLSSKRARLQAEANGVKFVVPEEVIKKNKAIADNEMALYASRQKELLGAYTILDERIKKANADLEEVKAEINRLVKSKSLLNEELKITSEMVKKRAVPKLEEMRLKREFGDIGGQINVLAQKRAGLNAELSGVKQERTSQEDKFRSQALGELNDVETQMSQLEESLKSIGDRVDRTELRSPVDGIVDKIAVTTIGGVIEPAMRLIEIVPVDNELKIIAKVSPSEIAFIKEGQDVTVKITAYDAQLYGSLAGKLVRIGANSVTDHEGNIFFEIEVRTEKNYMGSEQHPLPITPGMVAETEVITGKRTIMTYLLKPILRARSRAFTEH